MPAMLPPERDLLDPVAFSVAEALADARERELTVVVTSTTDWLASLEEEVTVESKVTVLELEVAEDSGEISEELGLAVDNSELELKVRLEELDAVVEDVEVVDDLEELEELDFCVDASDEDDEDDEDDSASMVGASTSPLT